MTPDASTDTSDDGRWLTYQELADIRRISKTSAIRLVMRHHWRRQRDNRGGVRILVPPGMLAPDRPSHDAPDDASAGTPAFETALSAIEAAHAAELASLRERTDEAIRRAGAAETDRREAITLVEKTVAMLADERGRAERAEAASDEERVRAESLRAQIDALNAEMVAAGAAADRAMADERMRADRLSAQVEALAAEVMRADAAGRDKERAEAGRDAERARADALHERIEALQEQLATRQEGVDATEAIRQAEAMVDSLREAHTGEISAKPIGLFVDAWPARHVQAGPGKVSCPGLSMPAVCAAAALPADTAV
jgi:hypothetical protein